MFASSGGAVNALALVAKHPEDVRTLVAHEPPLAAILPDREDAMAASRAVHDTYQRSGFGAGMAHFIAVVSHQGEFPDDFAAAAGPGPGDVRAADRGRRLPDRSADAARTCRHGTHYEPDFDALRGASTRIVMAAGVESEGEMAEPRRVRGRRAARHRAGRLPERPRRVHGRRVRPGPVSPRRSPRSCARSWGA